MLTHEAIIDVLWDTNIRPLLLKRFPDATPDELVKAHAYVYGGAIIQDIGYYPHGNKFFSDLAHYFRSGDFIVSLLRNSQTLNEYAFAIGAMAHYAADNDGHRLATNVAVPMLYPELKKKYGPVVTYEDNPIAHIKTEFAFDVLQVAKGHYAPESYHNFVGFEVSLPVVERAFKETYGIELKSVISNEQRAANSYRSSVNGLIPRATRVAWNLKQNEIQKDEPGITRKKFLYNLSRASYEKEWGKDYQRPTASDKFLAFVIRILPKIGPLRILTFRTPTPEAQKLFENSFNLTVDRYRSLLNQLGEGELQTSQRQLRCGRSHSARAIQAWRQNVRGASRSSCQAAYGGRRSGTEDTIAGVLRNKRQFQHNEKTRQIRGENSAGNQGVTGQSGSFDKCRRVRRDWRESQNLHTRQRTRYSICSIALLTRGD